jgi:acetyltransferase-like isoleucine patch superfamily enzyme
MLGRTKKLWPRLWMRYAGAGPLGRVAAWLATFFVPPYYSRVYLAGLNPRGYVSPRATIHHSELLRSPGVFIDDRVFIYKDLNGGQVELGRNVQIYRDTIIQTGAGGSISIGSRTTIQPRCQFSAYKGRIQIGEDVQIAPNCCFYPYDHSVRPGELIKNQPLQTKGGIVVEDDVWLGVGVIVLDGVRICRGAVIGAGSVVTKNIPEESIAVGSPARIVKTRSQVSREQARVTHPR